MSREIGQREGGLQRNQTSKVLVDRDFQEQNRQGEKSNGNKRVDEGWAEKSGNYHMKHC